MADDDDKRKRFLEDDDDDAPPPRPKRRGGDGPPVLFLVGLVAGVLAVTGCCGTSGWWVFANVLRGGSAGGGGGGWSLFAADEVRITTATRGPGFGVGFGGGFGGAPQISWAAVVTTNGATDLHQYVLVTEPFPMSPFKDTNISQSLPRPQFRTVTGPIDVWVEKRKVPGQPGKRVSNTATIR
ncbi:MAG: hypothetical protein ABGY75_11680 [Gemmataceae bacterium]